MMDRDERQLFTETITAAAQSATGEALDAALSEIGWTYALTDDTRAAVTDLFEAQGAAGATSSSLGLVVADALGIEVPEGTSVLLPAMGTASPTASGGIGLEDLRRNASVLVAAVEGDKAHISWLDRADVVLREVGGLDPRAGLVVVETASGSGDTAADSATSPASGSWVEAVMAARRAVAHEMVGAMRTMLAQATEHALDRVQFGQPIAGFQAIRHKLAECLVAIEAAAAALDGAWVDPSPLTCALAKAVAGNSARVVRKHCQQVLAGIGFTTEHELHNFVRRTMVLDGLFGDARMLTSEIGTQLIAQRRLPDLLPL
jgi:hypothetical protein